MKKNTLNNLLNNKVVNISVATIVTLSISGGMVFRYFNGRIVEEDTNPTEYCMEVEEETESQEVEQEESDKIKQDIENAENNREEWTRKLENEDVNDPMFIENYNRLVEIYTDYNGLRDADVRAIMVDKQNEILETSKNQYWGEIQSMQYNMDENSILQDLGTEIKMDLGYHSDHHSDNIDKMMNMINERIANN